MAFTPSRSVISPFMSKKEATIGTDPTLSGSADGVLTYSSACPFQPDFARVEFRPHSSSLTSQTDIITRRVWSIATQFAFSGSGTRGDPTIAGFKGMLSMFLAAGNASAFTTTSGPITIVPATIAQLNTPATAVSGSTAASGPATMACDYNGKYHEANSVWGNIVMSGSPTSGVMCDFRGMGLYVEPTNLGSEFNSWTGGANRTQPCLGISGTVTPSGGSAYTPVIRGFSFDMGVSVAPVLDCNSSTGLFSLMVIDRRPTLTLTIGLDAQNGSALDYEDIYGDVTGHTVHAVAFTVTSGSSGNICAFSFPTVQPIGIRMSDNGGIRDASITYKVQHTTAETEWAISIT